MSQLQTPVKGETQQQFSAAVLAVLESVESEPANYGGWKIHDALMHLLRIEPKSVACCSRYSMPNGLMGNRMMMSILLLSLPLLCAAEMLPLLMSNASYPFYYKWSPTTKVFEKEKMQLLNSVPAVQPDFRTKSGDAAFRSFSQRKQDWLLIELNGDQSGGYFVDLAANDWIKYSNTFLVEYFNGWDGVCVEPNPRYLENLLSYRKCKIFVNPVTDQIGDEVNFSFGNAEFGGIVGAEYDNKAADGASDTLYTVTLTDILKEANAPQIIDYISLDVEGAEYVSMLGFNFSHYTFTMMMIERPSKLLHKLLAKHGYVYVYTMNYFGDVLYLHHTFKNLEQEMKNKNQGGIPGSWGSADISYLGHPTWHGSYKPPKTEEEADEDSN